MGGSGGGVTEEFLSNGAQLLEDDWEWGPRMRSDGPALGAQLGDGRRDRRLHIERWTRLLEDILEAGGGVIDTLVWHRVCMQLPKHDAECVYVDRCGYG